jgi:hypothetical protein
MIVFASLSIITAPPRPFESYSYPIDDGSQAADEMKYFIFAESKEVGSFKPDYIPY